MVLKSRAERPVVQTDGAGGDCLAPSIRSTLLCDHEKLAEDRRRTYRRYGTWSPCRLWRRGQRHQHTERPVQSGCADLASEQRRDVNADARRRDAVTDTKLDADSARGNAIAIADCDRDSNSNSNSNRHCARGNGTDQRRLR